MFREVNAISQKTGIHRDRFLGAATEGLMYAAGKYDRARGAFSTYAVKCIRGYIYRCVGEEKYGSVRDGRRHVAGKLPDINSTDLDSFIETASVEPDEWPDAVLGRAEAKKQVEALLKCLPKRSRLILSLRFGLRGRQHRLREVGQVLGLSRQRVQQLEVAALGKLRRVAEGE